MDLRRKAYFDRRVANFKLRNINRLRKPLKSTQVVGEFEIPYWMLEYLIEEAGGRGKKAVQEVVIGFIRPALELNAGKRRNRERDCDMGVVKLNFGGELGQRVIDWRVRNRAGWNEAIQDLIWYGMNVG